LLESQWDKWDCLLHIFPPLKIAGELCCLVWEKAVADFELEQV